MNEELQKIQNLINNYNNVLERIDIRKKNKFNPFTLVLISIPIFVILLLVIVASINPNTNGMWIFILAAILFIIAIIGKSMVNWKKRDELIALENELVEAYQACYNEICNYYSECFDVSKIIVESEFELLNPLYPQLIQKTSFVYKYDKTKNVKPINHYNFCLSVTQIEAVKELLNDKFKS